MYGIFTQGRNGLNWCGNEQSLERARELLEDYRAREDVDFAMVLPVTAFLDIDGERESE
jgi:hypothetical protein